MKDVYKLSLDLHKKYKGKIEINSKMEVKNKDDLSLVYSPGVAEPCREIQKDINNMYEYTAKGNTVAVITDGSAVLGLGNIGPHASLPVMEGKSILLKNFADVDSFPLCLDTQDADEIIKTCKLLAPSLGGINLEDISAPRCVEIETKLQKELDIPVFHDDQHGTAIITASAIINACKLRKRKMSDLKVVIAGTGAAGSSIIKMLIRLGITNIVAYNSNGILHSSKKDSYNFLEKELLEITNKEDELYNDSLQEALVGANVFIGVSVAGIVSKEMIEGMADDPFIFAMANPTPEVMPEVAKAAGAKIIGTGRSDYPNQVNNVLAFPGIFRGALDSKATKITEEMKYAAAIAIAETLDEKDLKDDYIIPSPFDERVMPNVAKAVAKKALEQGITRK